MSPVCCICTGRHHPANCVQAHAIFDQCAEPTPGDYMPAASIVPAPARREMLVADLDAHRVARRQRSALPAAERSAKRAERHRLRGRRVG